VFHSPLLRIHIPNDDHLFPSCLETQIGDFGEQEPEWAVDQILSHKGSRTDATFQVLWCVGDITWFAYNQIKHLNALVEYLELLGLSSISQLTAGPGIPLKVVPRSPPSSASPRGSHSSKAHPVPQIPPSLLTPPSLPVIPLNSLILAIPLVNFIECGRDFAITNPDDINETWLVARDQLHTFITYSHTLRNKAPSAHPTCPLGYEYFIRAYNHEGLASTASFINEQGIIKSEGVSIEMSNLLEEEDKDVTLSAMWMEQVDHMVWHTALSAAHQRDKIEERRMMNKKGKNFAKKQQTKALKKGLGGIWKEPHRPLPLASTSSSQPEAMNTSG
jgi:hypothetical protein